MVIGGLKCIYSRGGCYHSWQCLPFYHLLLLCLKYSSSLLCNLCGFFFIHSWIKVSRIWRHLTRLWSVLTSLVLPRPYLFHLNLFPFISVSWSFKTHKPWFANFAFHECKGLFPIYRLGEMVPWAKCLLHKHKGLGSNPQHPCETHPGSMCL